MPWRALRELQRSPLNTRELRGPDRPQTASETSREPPTVPERPREPQRLPQSFRELKLKRERDPGSHRRDPEVLAARKSAGRARLHDHQILPGTALDPPNGGARRVNSMNTLGTKVVVLLR